MRTTLSLFVVLGLAAGCIVKSTDDKTTSPEGTAGTGGGEESRARGTVVSRGGGEARKPTVKLKSKKPARLARTDATPPDEEPKPKPARLTKTKLEVAGFAPTAGGPGSKIEVFGTGFSSETTVSVDGTAWTVDEILADRVIVSVPEGAADGKLTVKSGKKSVTTERAFSVLAADDAFGKPAPAPNGLLGEVFVVTDAALASMPDFSALGEPVAVIGIGPVDIAATRFEQGFAGPSGKVSTNFAIRFTGSLNVVTAGEYDLCMTSDDGSRLFLEDNLVLDHDGAHDASEKCELVYLDAGEYMLRLEYFQGASEGVALQLMWALDGGEKLVVPVDALFRPAP
jgi:hypothetical protein